MNDGATGIKILAWAACAVLLYSFVCPGALTQHPESVAALFRGGLPGENQRLAAGLSDELAQAGYKMVELDGDGLCDKAKLDASTVDLLVLPDAAHLPTGSIETIRAYIEAGGDIIALNAPLWQKLYVKIAGNWVSGDEYELRSATELPENVLFNFTPDNIAGWQRNHGPDDKAAVYDTVEDGPAPGRRSLHAQISDLRNWDNFGPTDLKKPFPEGHTLTIFAAKGGPNTRGLAIEWQEADGARWIATVPLSTEWRRYVLAPEDFKFWESVPQRKDDRFQPENAKRMTIGMAFTHTGNTPGPQEFWVGGFGTAAEKPEMKELIHKPVTPAIDTLAPGYKFFDSHGVAQLATRAEQVIMPAARSDVPDVLRSAQPRPGGGGFDKGRAWRWIPLLEAKADNSQWRGAPATLMVHARDAFKGGQWAAFGIVDSEWYLSAAILSGIGAVARKMLNGVYIVDGGSNFYTYFEDQDLLLGVRAANLAQDRRAGLTAKVRVADAESGAEVSSKEWPVSLYGGEETTVQESWKPAQWPSKGFRITAELLDHGVVIDRVSHEAHVWKSKEKKSYIQIRDGDFMLDGKRWRAHGVNYMPSSGIGTEDGEYFEYWLGARSYDPEIIQRDLEHIKDLGLNAVSIFVYEKSIKAQNLLDLLRRLDELGLKANLSLRPGTIGDFQWPGMQAAIEYYRLWEHDCIFAYDTDWEPMWWTHKERTKWDRAWQAWVVERYGSVENAERDWGCAAPKDPEGAMTNPADEQFNKDGDWRVMVAAYRRFLDTLLYKEYSTMRERIRAIDPHHFVSFRMTEAGDPTMNWGGVLPYDYPYLAAAVDIIEPEGYGRIGDWEKVKPGWFEFEYARWAAPRHPVMWAEAGVHAWDMGAGTFTPKLLETQGRFYRDFYRMLTSSGADGIFWWWYPGGFRYGENSDYGIINPDGTDRESSKAIRENGPSFINGPDTKPVDTWIEIDRDHHTDGVVGIYEEAKEQFWKAIAEGHTPGLKTAGTGTTSADCPPIAVGNTPYNGTNPPKYLDGVFDKVEVLDRKGHWVVVDKGGKVEVASGAQPRARVSYTNLGEAEWVHEGPGTVYITAASNQNTRVPLSGSLPHMGSVRELDLPLTPNVLTEPAEATISFSSGDQRPFGEKFKITLVP
jgi:hypothetical protein